MLRADLPAGLAGWGEGPRPGAGASGGNPESQSVQQTPPDKASRTSSAQDTWAQPEGHFRPWLPFPPSNQIPSASSPCLDRVPHGLHLQGRTLSRRRRPPARHGSEGGPRKLQRLRQPASAGAAGPRPPPGPVHSGLPFSLPPPDTLVLPSDLGKRPGQVSPEKATGSQETALLPDCSQGTAWPIAAHGSALPTPPPTPDQEASCGAGKALAGSLPLTLSSRQWAKFH